MQENENYNNTQQNNSSYETDVNPNSSPVSQNTKYCKYCGSIIPMDAVICTHCGRQVEELKNSSQGIVINNTAIANPNVTVSPNIVNSSNSNANINNGYNINRQIYGGPKPKDKWVAFLLCFFLGFLGFHKFYEGKVLLGVIYIFTFGLCGIGVIVDLIILLLKPNPYFV